MITINGRDEKRFWDKVDCGKWDECWYWKSFHSISKTGYGRINVRGKIFHSNRMAWMLYHEQVIPDGMIVLHSKICIENAERDFGDGKKSRLCCNPAHLRLGTYLENNNDTKNQGRMKGWFPKGHISFCGESHPKHKLSSLQVEEIMKDSRTNKIIAKEYGINPATVSRIQLGQRRKAG